MVKSQGQGQGLSALTGTMSSGEDSSSFPYNQSLLPHKCSHAWAWHHNDKFQSLMAKLSSPIRICLLSCKTFSGLTREHLGGKGKRLGFQNIKLPLPLLPANLPANHLEKRKPTHLRGSRGRGLLTAAPPADSPCLSSRKGPWKVNSPLLLPWPRLASRRERNLAQPKEQFSFHTW